MLHEVLWSPFSLDRILYEDEYLIVIDKPANLSTHAPEAGGTNDAFSRVRMMIAERDRLPIESVYLGIHQRLDRDTSGVLCFTKHRSANASLAAQFEGRKVRKSYVAVVSGWTEKAASGRFSDWLAESGPGTRMKVVNAKGAARTKAIQAITRYLVAARSGDRALLELTPETGRTHQLRVQLASRKAPVAGDPWYGGARAPRLLLHAKSLQIVHPITGESLSFAAPVPAEFEQWMQAPQLDRSRSKEHLARLFEAAVGSRWPLAHAPKPTTAFRLLHGDTEGVPGCALDQYGDYLVLHSSSDEIDAARSTILDIVAELGPRGVYYKKHPKQANTLVDPRGGDLAPPRAVWGEDAPDPLPILENGIRYLVRLGDGLKTGIFLDQRDNRRRIQSLAPGKTVLNLFAYTCAFTVAAAVGGAVSSVSVDVSAAALAWGEENLAANAIPLEPHKMVVGDVFAWLRRAVREGQKFDIVILDPPSYATTHSSRFVAESDYPRLAAEALALLSPGGMLLACTNHRRIAVSKFRRFLHDAARLAGGPIRKLKDFGLPADFPPDPELGGHLKSVLVTLE